MWQRLGTRTLILYIIKGFMPGLILLFFALLIIGLKSLILSSFSVNTGGINLQNINISQIILGVAGFAAVVSFPIIALGIALNVARYFSFRYILEADDLRIHKGLIGRGEISIPYTKIEDINLDQSIFYRIIGVAKLFVITGGETEKGDGRGET